MFAALLGAGLGLLGGSKGQEQTQTRQMDPRLDKYVYGDATNNGLLADAQSVYNRQMATGGLNDLQRQGMDMQYQYLMSPQYQQGAQSMFNMGSSLLGGGIAGNPFTTGQIPTRQPLGGRQMGARPGVSQSPVMAQPSQGFSFRPYQPMPSADYSVKPKEPPAITEADFEKWYLAYLDRLARAGANHGSGDGFGGGFGGAGDASDGDGPSGEA